MNPTLRDLRAALEDEALRAGLPAADAVVAGAARRVRAARRRRATVVGALAALVLGTGLVTSMRVGRHSSLPAGPGPFRVVASGGDFPAYSDGSRRLLVVTAPAAKGLTGTIDVPTTPGRELMVLPVCTPAALFDAGPSLTFTATPRTEEAVPLGCMPEPGIPGGSALLGPATGRRTPVDIHLLIGDGRTRSAMSFLGARVTLGFYESVPWAQYQLPARPSGYDTDPDRVWGTPKDPRVQVIAPNTTAQAARTVSVSLPVTGHEDLSIETRGPGRLKLIINGRTLDPADVPGRRIEDGFVESFDYVVTGTGIALGHYPPASGATPGRLDLVVIPEGFAGPDWRVVVGRQP